MDMNIDFEVSKLSKISVSPDDVLLVKIPFEKYTVELLQSVFNAFKCCFPDNPCMLIPDNCDVQIVSSELVKDFAPATQEELFDFLNIKNRREDSNAYGQEVQN